MCQAINIFGDSDYSPADAAKLCVVNLRRRVGYTFGLGDGTVVCGFPFGGILRPSPSPSTSDVGQSLSPSVTSADADEAKLRLVNLRRQVGFTFGLGDGSVVCGFSFKGTLVPFTTIATIAGVPSHPDVIGVQTSEGWLSLHDAPCATLDRLDEVSCCLS